MRSERMKAMAAAACAVAMASGLAGCGVSEASGSASGAAVKLSPTEKRMARAIMTAENLHMTSANYAALTTERMRLKVEAGAAFDWKKQDMEGVSFAHTDDNLQAVVALRLGACQSQVESMRAALTRLRLVSDPDQVMCVGGAMVATSDPKR